MKIGEIPRFLHKNLQFFKNITEGSVELKKNICNIYKNPLYIRVTPIGSTFEFQPEHLGTFRH